MGIESFKQFPSALPESQKKTPDKKYSPDKIKKFVGRAILGATLAWGSGAVNKQVEAYEIPKAERNIEVSKEILIPQKKLEAAINSVIIKENDLRKWQELGGESPAVKLEGKTVTVATTERGIKWAAPMIKRMQALGMDVTYSIKEPNSKISKGAYLRYTFNDLERVQKLQSIFGDIGRLTIDSTGELVDLELVVE